MTQLIRHTIFVKELQSGGNVESDEVAEVDYTIIQAYFEKDSNVAALLSDPDQDASLEK